MQSTLPSKSTQNQITSYTFQHHLSCWLLRECLQGLLVSAPLSPYSIFNTLCPCNIPSDIWSQTCLQGPEQSGPSSISLVSSLAHSALGTRTFCCFPQPSHMFLPQGLCSFCSFHEFSSSKYLPEFSLTFFRSFLECHLLSEALWDQHI